MNIERRVTEIITKPQSFQTEEVGFSLPENASPVRKTAEIMLSNVAAEIQGWHAKKLPRERYDSFNFDLAFASTVFASSLILLEETRVNGYVDKEMMGKLFKKTTGISAHFDYQKIMSDIPELSYTEYNENLVFTAEKDKTFASFFENRNAMPPQIDACLRAKPKWMKIISQNILPKYKETMEKVVNGAGLG